MKAKTKLLFVVVPFLLLLLVPNVFALTAIWSLGWGSKDNDWTFNAGYYVGQIVTGTDAYLDSCQFPIENGTADMMGDSIAYVYPTDGFGDITDGTSPLEASNVVSLDEVSEYTWLIWNFSGTTFLTNLTEYAVVVRAVPGLSGHLHMAVDTTGTGGIASNNGITWSDAGAEMIGTVWVSSEYGTGGSGTGWDTGDTSELIDNAMAFLVPVVVMLLPALLFIIFFKRTDKWLILIGLAIGVGLGYYFFGIPIWLVFLVAIGLIGFAYSEVRRNG